MSLRKNKDNVVSYDWKWICEKMILKNQGQTETKIQLMIWCEKTAIASLKW